MDCPVCGTWLSSNGGGWVHHARTHVREGKIKESIAQETGNYVFHYKRSNVPVEPWRGGQTWQERKAVERNMKKPKEVCSKEHTAVRDEAYKTAKEYITRRRIKVNQADRLELAAIIADSKADGLEEFKVIDYYLERVMLFRKVAKGLRREATTERRKT